MSHIKTFWNNLAALPNYRDALVGWYNEHNADDQEQALLFRDLGDTSSWNILDFGCGPGRCIIKFKNLFNRIDGADVSEVILQKAVSDLTEAGVAIPNLYLSNGRTLEGVPDAQYELVYSIICQQHISSRSWRLNLYEEFFRVLKPGGVLSFQMGFGPGHPISVDYFYSYDGTETNHFDTRVENPADLEADLVSKGFGDFTYVLTPPNHDQHPQWIWAQCKKPI